MNLGAWPDGVAFDPAGGVDSLELKAIVSGPGASWTAVLLASDARALRSGWGARAAIALAEVWAAAGRRVILADLVLDRPELHEHLGEANSEGLADVFLFGASLASVTHSSPGRSFEFVPPGAFIGEAAAVYASREWHALLNGVRADDAILLAYAPLEAAHVSTLAERLGQVIILAAEPDAAEREPAIASSLVQLVLRPPAPLPAGHLVALGGVDVDEQEPGIARRPPPEDVATGVTPAGPARGDDEEFERIRLPKDEAREALIADLRQRQREAMLVPPPDFGRRTESPRSQVTESPARAPVDAADEKPLVALTEPDFAAAVQPRRTPRSRRGVIIITLFVVAVLSVIAGTWRLVAGILEQRRATQQVNGPTPLPPQSSPAAPSPLSHSVAIEAHQDLATALARVDALLAEDDEFSFYITPVLVDEAVYYRIMSGPVTDSAAAASLMAALLGAGHKTGASDFDIRSTPFAFLLGSATTRADAERRVQELRTLAIPAYIVMDDAAEGVVYRVYGGGYAGRAEAEVMHELLRSAGQPDSLVERMGRSPQ
jgi:Mrp family chromosome partitioning ATPase